MAQDVTLYLNRPDAIEVHNTISIMAGGVQHRQLRTHICRKIREKWPEITHTEAPPDANVARRITLSGREIRALAEGFILLFIHGPQGQGLTGGQHEELMKTCKVCRCQSYVEKKLEEAANKLTNLDEGELDAEPTEEELAAKQKELDAADQEEPAGRATTISPPSQEAEDAPRAGKPAPEPDPVHQEAVRLAQ